MPTTIDHTAYPEIIDTILEHASCKALLAFSATSKHYRDRLCPVHNHVALHRNTTTNKTGFTSPDGTRTARLLWPAIHTLDLTETTWYARTTQSEDYDSTSAVTELQVIRRHRAPAERPNYPRTPNLIYHTEYPWTIVDYIDLDAIPSWWNDADGTPVIRLDQEHLVHILHLRWIDDDSDTPFPPLKFESMDETEVYRVVLWPKSANGAAASHPRRALHSLPNLLLSMFPLHYDAVHVVGPEAYRAVLEDEGWFYTPFEVWRTSLSSKQACVSEWAKPIDSP